MDSNKNKLPCTPMFTPDGVTHLLWDVTSPVGTLNDDMDVLHGLVVVSEDGLDVVFQISSSIMGLSQI